jgi:putative oxidoreductase
MIWKGLEKYRDVGLLVVRLGFGLGYIYFHGWSKLTGGPELWAGVGGAMSNFGIGFGHAFFGFLAALAETLGALLFAAGLFFRPASAVLCFTMFVATVNHIASGVGTPAHAFKNMWVFLGFMMIGPGKYSLDALLSRKLEGGTGDA